MATTTETQRFEDYKNLTLRVLYNQSESGDIDKGMGPVLEFLNSLDGIATTACCSGHDDQSAFVAFAVRDRDLWQYLQGIFEGTLRQHPYRIKGVDFGADTWNTDFVRYLVVVNIDTEVAASESIEVLSECAMSVAVAVRAQKDGILDSLMNQKVM